MINNIYEMFDYLDSINDTTDGQYDDCKMHSLVPHDCHMI